MDNLLAPEDSKRVADALIVAIESLQLTIQNRVDAMCQQMEANHWQAEQQRIPFNR